MKKYILLLCIIMTVAFAAYGVYASRNRILTDRPDWCNDWVKIRTSV